MSGTWLTLTGNLSPEGLQLKMDGLPAKMQGFRGRAFFFQTPAAAAAAMLDGTLGRGCLAAIFCAPDIAVIDGDMLAQTARQAGLDDTVCVLTDAEVTGGTGLAWLRAATPRSARHVRAVLRQRDMVEYDTVWRTVQADITEEGLQARLDGAEGSYVVRQLDERTWSILDHYSRMFLVAGEERAVLIDTGFGSGDIDAAVRALTDLPYHVCLTHGHWDHAGGLPQLRDVWMGLEDAELLPDVTRENDVCYSGACRLHELKAQSVLDLGGRVLSVLPFSGHTAGGRMLLDRAGKMLFAGDSIARGPTYLFMDQCCPAALEEHLKQISLVLPDGCRIYAAHRTMQLDASYATDMAACIHQAFSGDLEGIETCVLGARVNCKTYHYGKCAIYLRDEDRCAGGTQ